MDRMPNESLIFSKNNLAAEMDTILLERFPQRLLLAEIYEKKKLIIRKTKESFIEAVLKKKDSVSPNEMVFAAKILSIRAEVLFQIWQKLALYCPTLRYAKLAALFLLRCSKFVETAVVEDPLFIPERGLKFSFSQLRTDEIEDILEISPEEPSRDSLRTAGPHSEERALEKINNKEFNDKFLSISPFVTESSLSHLQQRTLKLLLLHFRRRMRFLQSYAFFKYRNVVQKIKFYSLVTMKNKLTDQLSLIYSSRTEPSMLSLSLGLSSPHKEKQLLLLKHCLRNKLCAQKFLKQRAFSKFRQTTLKQRAWESEQAFCQVSLEVQKTLIKEEENDTRLRNIKQDLNLLVSHKFNFC